MRWWRCRWLIALFRQDGIVEVEDLPGLFDPAFNVALDDSLWDAAQHSVETVPITLMFLFRAFFFDDRVWLDRMLAIARRHASRLVRDAALLVDEFEGGRTQLGKIDDIHELRRAFIALDLDPARAAQREAEAQAAREAEEARMSYALRCATRRRGRTGAPSARTTRASTTNSAPARAPSSATGPRCATSALAPSG